MKRLKPFLCFLLLLLTGIYLQAQQVNDSTVAAKDTTKPVIQKKITTTVKPYKDTLVKDSAAVVTSGFNSNTVTYRSVLAGHPWYAFLRKPVARIEQERIQSSKDLFFYIIAGLSFFLAIIKASFPKYLDNLFAIVFRASLKQKQIREQLLIAALPSLLMNIFFTLSAGLFVFFLLRHYNLLQQVDDWLLLTYCFAAVAGVYLVKYLSLRFTGWVFNIKEAAATYIFIVYLVNKLMAVFLLPIVCLLAFAPLSWQTPLITIGYAVIIVFFLYRYLVSFAPVRREVKVSQFHFFIYLCAFEIAPLLLMYKVLLRFL